ncbi:MAG TPA: hypothetical protein VGB28_00150, partial [Actinomycetota bacterium]
MSRRAQAAAAIAALMTLLMAGTARATITGTSGQVTLIAPPPSVLFHALQSNDTTFAFDEQQDVTLTSDLTVNITVPGHYDQAAELTPGTIPAGTVVRSHFIHVDKVGQHAPYVTYEGCITVDSDIIGVSVRGASLSAGDPLVGWPATTYPTGQIERQLEMRPDGSEDEVTLDVGIRDLCFHSENAAHVDQIR